MFQDLVELGKAVAKDNDLLNLFKEDIGENYTVGIAIDFSEDGRKFEGCHTEKFEGEKRRGVPYKKGPSNSFDPLPVTRFGGDTSKVIKRIGKYLKNISITMNDEALQQLAECYHSSISELAISISEKIESAKLSQKMGAFLFLRMGEEPLWKSPVVKRYFEQWIPHRFAEKDKYTTLKENALCSVCGEKKPVVYGNVRLLTCYNLYQPEANAGGCNPLAGVKNLPICLECAGYLNKGFDYANTHLKFFMGGLNYLLIPRLSSEPEKGFLKKIIDSLMVKDKGTEVTLNEEKLRQFAGNEDSILRRIAKNFADRDELIFRMVFYVSANEKWRIVAEIPRILPSRLKAIYDAKTEAEKMLFLRRDKKPDHVSVVFISQMCKSTKMKFFDKSKFLSYISAIFGEEKLSYKKVLHDIVGKLSNEYRTQSEGADWFARHSLLFLDFLNRLNVIQLPEGGNMEGENLPAQEYVSFINEHKRFFCSPGKEVAFLTGAVIGKLLEFQRKQRNSEPFRSKLGNYRFDRKKLAKLRGLLEEKLAAYERDAKSLTYTRSLRSLLDIAWAEAGQDLEENDDELTLATIMGMNLSYYIGTHKNKEEKDAE